MVHEDECITEKEKTKQKMEPTLGTWMRYCGIVTFLSLKWRRFELLRDGMEFDTVNHLITLNSRSSRRVNDTNI